MNTTKKNANVRFVIDFINKTITGTRASFNKASKGYGPEYEELAEKIAKHPDFKLDIKEQKSRSNKVKKTYDGLNFPFMEAYISTLENAEALTKEYEEVKSMAKNTGSKLYPFTKKWFLRKFGTEEKPFDMAEAKEAIYQFRINQAQGNALSILST